MERVNQFLTEQYDQQRLLGLRDFTEQASDLLYRFSADKAYNVLLLSSPAITSILCAPVSYIEQHSELEIDQKEWTLIIGFTTASLILPIVAPFLALVALCLFAHKINEPLMAEALVIKPDLLNRINREETAAQAAAS